MFTKTILLTLIVACGAPSNSAAIPESAAAPEPDDPNPDREPPDDTQEDQHFCCSSIDTKNWTGEDCTLLSKDNIVLCNTVLYCPGKWGKEDGHVTCG